MIIEDLTIFSWYLFETNIVAHYLIFYCILYNKTDFFYGGVTNCPRNSTEVSDFIIRIMLSIYINKMYYTIFLTIGQALPKEVIKMIPWATAVFLAIAIAWCGCSNLDDNRKKLLGIIQIDCNYRFNKSYSEST